MVRVATHILTHNPLHWRLLAIDRTRTHSLLTLPSQLRCSELLFVCVGSCIYIRGLCGPPHSPPPPLFRWKTKRTKAIVLLSNDFWISQSQFVLFWRWLGGCGDVEAVQRSFFGGGGLGLVKQHSTETRWILRLTAVGLRIRVFSLLKFGATLWPCSFDMWLAEIR